MVAPPVVFPTSLSPSRANDFLSCPLRYRYRTIDQLSEDPSPTAIRGTLIHRVLEELFSLPADQRTVTEAFDLLQQIFETAAEQDPDQAALLTSAGITPTKSRSLIEHYFTMEHPARIQPAHRELGIAAMIVDGFTIRGFIDRVDRSADGRIRIVDYKTGKAPRPGFESDAMFQMRFYALAWWRSTGDVPAMLQLLYLGSQDIVRYEPRESELIATERKILAVRDAIQRSATAGVFHPSPSKLCQWCSFQSVCPAFGGEPLPLPDPTMWVSGSLSDAEQSTMLDAARADGTRMPHA